MEQNTYIGTSVQRKDAFDKVNGSIKFNIDYTAPGLLHARMLTSPYAHAWIKFLSITVLEIGVISYYYHHTL